MKIGVVSDTHSRELPQQMINDFKDVDVIIHAGDFCSLQDYHQLAATQEVKAVYGNMDEPDIRELFPRKQILKFEDCLIGLFHGEGPPNRLLERVKEEFNNEQVHVVIFGHSHLPCNEKSEDVLYFNPGSPNDTLFAPYCSYGILNINKDQIKAKIIKVK